MSEFVSGLLIGLVAGPFLFSLLDIGIKAIYQAHYRRVLRERSMEIKRLLEEARPRLETDRGHVARRL